MYDFIAGIITGITIIHIINYYNNSGPPFSPCPMMIAGVYKDMNVECPYKKQSVFKSGSISQILNECQEIESNPNAEINSINTNSIHNESRTNMGPIPLSDSDYELILYYMPTCQYSIKFLPIWEAFELYAKDNFPTLKVSKTTSNETLLERNIESYPSLVLYSKPCSPKIFLPKVFHGERTVESLTDFVRENI